MKVYVLTRLLNHGYDGSETLSVHKSIETAKVAARQKARPWTNGITAQAPLPTLVWSEDEDFFDYVSEPFDYYTYVINEMELAE